MARVSAGILLWRRTASGLEVLVVHPGGPFWASKDLGAWSIAKGEVEAGETPEQTARREFVEETGWPVPAQLVALGTIRQKAGKVVHGFAAEGAVDPATLASPTIRVEWPRGSGLVRSFPELDRAAWFSPSEAVRRLNPAQAPFVERLAARLS
jgi:predicted NUDIX family NTP pyrophosphohydrolase